jgi:microcystin-dependent protein
LIWSGSVATIPNGFVLCNGLNGTPNLSGRFILGTSTSHTIGQMGGEEQHILTVAEMPSHNHSGWTDVQGNHTHPVNTGGASLPADPFYFIKRSGYNAGDGYSYGDSSLGPAIGYSGAHSHTVYTNNTGNGLAHNILPPYYSLAYIMKL